MIKLREILFRGKAKFENGSIKKGDWVCGDLVRLRDGNKTITHIYGYGEVLPETVGQFTGMKSKDGTKIFEGDIVDIYFKQNNKEFVAFGKIVYECDGFCIDDDLIGILPLGGYTEENIKILGNEFDNPELLRGDNNA